MICKVQSLTFQRLSLGLERENFRKFKIFISRFWRRLRTRPVFDRCLTRVLPSPLTIKKSRLLVCLLCLKKKTHKVDWEQSVFVHEILRATRKVENMQMRWEKEDKDETVRGMGRSHTASLIYKCYIFPVPLKQGSITSHCSENEPETSSTSDKNR